MTNGSADRWRIGVLATRVGVSETVLRAWETRYGLLRPARTASGYRLYGPEDERRAQAMVAARTRGVPAAQAAAEVLARDRATLPDEAPDAAPRPAGPAPDVDPGAVAAVEAVEALHSAMVGYDSAEMHGVLDAVFGSMSVEAAIRDVLFPFLRRVGEGWANGHVSIADEHFATDVVRGRLGALTFSAGATSGPLALLACTPHEAHDIPLKAFEVVLQRAGWRTRFLGAQTPFEALKVACDIIEPDAVVLSGSVPVAFNGLTGVLDELVGEVRVYLAGRGVDDDLAERLGVVVLTGDPVEAAMTLSASR